MNPIAKFPINLDNMCCRGSDRRNILRDNRRFQATHDDKRRRGALDHPDMNRTSDDGDCSIWPMRRWGKEKLQPQIMFSCAAYMTYLLTCQVG